MGGGGGWSGDPQAFSRGAKGLSDQVEDRALRDIQAKEGCTGTVRGSRWSALVFGFVVGTGTALGGSTGGGRSGTCSIERAAWSMGSRERVCLGLWLGWCGAGGEGPGVGPLRNHLEGDAPPPQTSGRSRGWFVRETMIAPSSRPGAGGGDGVHGEVVVPEPVGGGEQTPGFGDMEEEEAHWNLTSTRSPRATKAPASGCMDTA